ncbi:hypothetical protein FXO37_32928 [Capsicum annuum]|nr:hypothetical protein FXO37_32928 [Capsicum annuum]
MKRDSEVTDPDVSQATPVRLQEQLLHNETQTLQVELNSLLDSVQETETKRAQVSALNHLMSTHILQQGKPPPLGFPDRFYHRGQRYTITPPEHSLQLSSYCALQRAILLKISLKMC